MRTIARNLNEKQAMTVALAWLLRSAGKSSVRLDIFQVGVIQHGEGDHGLVLETSGSTTLSDSQWLRAGGEQIEGLVLNTLAAVKRLSFKCERCGQVPKRHTGKYGDSYSHKCGNPYRPKPGTLAFTAMLLAESGAMTGEEADEWKEFMKEQRLREDE